jgi:Domain of Unknown Function with PDB structure (DUF3857)/Transglutaminase-like superfamily
MNAKGRISLCCCAFALATGLISSRAGHASWFSKGQPVPDWGLTAAKTRVPEYAKDAEAVILYDEYVETVDAQGRATEREREAIRILKPQGRDHSCAVSFDETQKINYFRVWTIASDEKQFQAQDTDFADRGDTDTPVMLSTRKTRVVHAPAVDVGATLICESEEQMEPFLQEKVWSFQSSLPVVFEALEVNFASNSTPASSWHNHEAVKPVAASANHWRWELKDVPGLTLRDVPSAPDWMALAGRMTVQWGQAAIDDRDKRWQAIGQWVTKLESDRTTPSPEITAKAKELVAGAPDFYTTVSRIAGMIQKDVRYFVVMRGIGGLQAHPAADIYRNRYGDCKDKAALLISMLQAAGIHAYFMPVDHRRGVVDPEDPSLVGDHMIVAIEMPADVQDAHLMAIVKATSGRRYLIFDPTDERTPVGNLSSELQGGYGLLACGDASQVIQLPVLPPEANGTERKGVFALAADGALTGTVDSYHSGPEGADLRTVLKYTDEKQRHDAFERIIDRDLPGAALDSLTFVQSPDFEKPAEIHYKVRDPQYAHSMGTLLLVRPRVVSSDTQPFDSKPRMFPIDLNSTGRWRDSFDITIPAGYVVDETPNPVDIDTEFARYRSSITVKGDLLHYEREFVVNKIEIPAEKSPAFRRLESAILTDERGTAVLKRR